MINFNSALDEFFRYTEQFKKNLKIDIKRKHSLRVMKNCEKLAIYLGLNNRTITPIIPYYDGSFILDFSGYIAAIYHDEDAGYAVLPTFYLNSDVTYVSGTGTQSDPYIIA